jgi:SAM-dependent methyltransferase
MSVETVTRADVYDMLACPRCQGGLTTCLTMVECRGCTASYALMGNIPAFLDRAPAGMEFSRKKDRVTGSPWRQANNAFFRSVAEAVAESSIVLEVGAGHSYLKNYFGVNYFATDVYPYEGLDFVCDLAEAPPLRPDAIDVVLLNNVLEHLPEPQHVLRSIARGLKRGGVIAIAVPFIIKVHQMPYDFLRYTHFMLYRMLQSEGFHSIRIEAVYTPGALHASLLTERVNAYAAATSAWKMFFARGTRVVASTLLRAADRLIADPGAVVKDVSLADGAHFNPWVAGYHVRAVKA